MGYLDNDGLSRVFTKLKALLNNKSDIGHTHNYAGSSSAGGSATSAVKLDSSAGSATQPVYFSSGKPVACTSYANATVGTANKLGTDTVGSTTKPIYLNAGTATASNATVGSSTKPVYMSSGTITASSDTVGGTAKPMYLSSGTMTACSSTVGSATAPVYMNAGTVTACGSSLGVSVTGSSASCTGNSATATKLATARTIGIGTGATGTATSFDGSSNITIPITSVSEAYLSWGGKNIAGNITPIGMACSTEHSANRLAFINGNALTFEYSSDGGSTWTDYGYSASVKSSFCTKEAGVPIGRTSASTEYTTNSKTRVTLSAQSYVHTDPRKLLINISSSGGMSVLIEYKTGASGAAWQTFGTYSLSGWSGWNDIPLVLDTLGGGSSQTGNNWFLRLTFSMTSVNSSYPTTAQVNAIRLFGMNNWGTASSINGKGPMSATGHLYSYDIDANATFPAGVTATTFTGSLSGNATTSSSCTGNAATATKLATTRTINGTGFDGTQNITTANWGTARNIYISDSAGSNTGAAVSVNGSGNATLKLPSTIAATLSGNASTATAFSASKSVALTGDVTGSASSTGGWSVATTLASSGVTAGSYGPSANASPAHSGTFSVPYITVDAKGRVTAASTKTITLPADNNTDTKVTNTLATTTKAYVTGTTSSSTNTGTQVFDTGVYLDTTAGQLTATTFKGALSGNATSATTASTATKATQDSAGQQINTTYIKGLSASGTTITYTKGDGTTGTITTQDTNTDTKVTQTITTTSANYPLLLAPSGQTATTTTTANFGTKFQANPSTGTLTATTFSGALSGNATSATTAASCSGNAATATKLATARTISLTGSVTGSGSFDGSGNLSIATTTNHTHNYLTVKGTNTISSTTNDTTANWGAQQSGVHWYTTSGYLNNQPSQYGYLLNIGQSSEVHQLWMTQSSGNMAHRGGDSSGWSGTWRILLDSANYTSYSPTLTGSGASGTWGISVTGNAATATTLATARTIQTNLGSTSSASFNGSANITPGVTGTLPVANGGTGATTLTSGAALIGNGTGAVATRSITDMTSKSYISYNTNLMTTNTLAYWNGAYSSAGASNLTYCNQGAFGTAATYAATTSVASGGTALVTSGGVYTALTNGTVSKVGTSTLGGTNKPIYLLNGVPTVCTGNAGSYTKPAYMSNGIITDCGSSLDVTSYRANSMVPITTAGTGSAYTATVSGITALTAGVSFIMVPNVVSASTAPTLNVNSLGAKTIRQRLSSNTTSTAALYSSSMLAAGKPVKMVYDGTYWIVDDMVRTDMAEAYGTLAIAHGGTGATTAADARKNLKAARVYYSTAAPSSTSGYNTNDLWICI